VFLITWELIQGVKVKGFITNQVVIYTDLVCTVGLTCPRLDSVLKRVLSYLNGIPKGTLIAYKIELMQNLLIFLFIFFPATIMFSCMINMWGIECD